MLFEVHTSARPGRPRALVALTAALLAASLGVAWLQVREARAMGPEQRISGTPLIVRPPRGWRFDPRNPRRLILPVAGGKLQRSIQFDYYRLPAFLPVEQLRQLPELQLRGAAQQEQPARIGGFPAAQIEQVLRAQLGRAVVETEVITRFTCLPRGDFIMITYEPLEAFRQSDYDMLDQVSASLRLDDPSLSGAAETYLAAAGLRMPVDPSWVVVGPELAEVPGLFVGGASDAGPAWSLALHRTWLAGRRQPADLLRDYAAHFWLTWEVDELLHVRQRADGAVVAEVRHPPTRGTPFSTLAALVVAQAPEQVVLLRVHAGLEHAEAALAAAHQVADGLELAALPAVPAPEDALQRGAQLAEQLRSGGLVARWGRAAVSTAYAPQEREELILVSREPVQRNADAGYRGSQRWQRERAQEDELRWTVDGRAGAYQWLYDFHYSTQMQVRVDERRVRADGPVVRQIFVNDQREQRFSYVPEAAFVAPPAESVVQGWVARNASEPVLYSTSSVLGPATHTYLLRSLSPDGVWPRVLVQADYRPEGAIIAFDEDRAEIQYERHPSATYRRIR